MSTEQIVLDFVNELKAFLSSRLNYFEVFTKHGVQVEGWFKGELLNFFENKKLDGVVAFDREVGIGLGRSKVDFTVDIRRNGLIEKVFIEIKHWLVGYQKGSRWTANSYFGDASSVGIKLDVTKLSHMKKYGKFMLILATANPGENDWKSGIRKFNSKFQPFKLESLTDPSDYPSVFFLGLLKV